MEDRKQTPWFLCWQQLTSAWISTLGQQLILWFQKRIKDSKRFLVKLGDGSPLSPNFKTKFCQHLWQSKGHSSCSPTNSKTGPYNSTFEERTSCRSTGVGGTVLCLWLPSGPQARERVTVLSDGLSVGTVDMAGPSCTLLAYNQRWSKALFVSSIKLSAQRHRNFLIARKYLNYTITRSLSKSPRGLTHLSSCRWLTGENNDLNHHCFNSDLNSQRF